MKKLMLVLAPMVASALMVSASWAQVPTCNGLPATIICQDRCFAGETVVNCELS